MLKISIVDDVKKIRDTLSAMIISNYTDAEIVSQSASVTEAYDHISTLSPNLVLLDIDLEDGDAFDLLKKIPTKNFHVIFITGSSNRAIEAIKNDAIDYILKPINPIELYAAIDKVKKIIEKKQADSTLQHISTVLKEIKQPKRLILNTHKQVYAISTNDIIRCEADGKYTLFHLLDGKKILMAVTLKEYEEQLVPYNFFRIHQSHLINTNFFDSILKQDDFMVLLTNGETLPLATRKKIEFFQFIETL